MSGGSSRVPIPEGVRRVIQNIREIARNHSEDEVHAMLKECNMDPNETVQKLLHQDSFHEVRRKRDKKKENNREPSDSRVRAGMQGRGGRGDRGPYPSRSAGNNALGRRNTSAGKENAVGQGLEKGNTSSSPTNVLDMEKKSLISTSSSVTTLANGPTKVDHLILPQACASPNSGVNAITCTEKSATETDKTGIIQSKHTDVKIGPESEQSVLISDPLPSTTPSSASGVYDSASDPVLVPSLDSCIPGAVGTIKHEAGSQQAVLEAAFNKGASFDVTGLESSSASRKESSDMGNSHIHGKMVTKSQEFATSQSSDTSHHVDSCLAGSMGSRPPSSYSSRSQQLNTSQKAGPSKEWKPRSTHVTSANASELVDTIDVLPSTVEAVVQPVPTSFTASDDTILKLEQKLEELKLSDTQHVIIPHHLQVPESERYGLSFGSFASSFKPSVGFENQPADDKSSSLQSESLQETGENVEDLSSVHNAVPSTHEEEYLDQQQSLTQMPESQPSAEVVVSSGTSAAPEYEQPKSEAPLISEGPQYSVAHTPPTYSAIGLIPPMLGSQFAPFESTETQGRDATRLPSFMVQQPFDPSASYYSQIYLPPTDGDGRFSPFLAPGVASKYNGNVAVAPPQTGQSSQEIGNSLVLSSAAPTSLTTQAAGVMQSSIPAAQQPVPVFRQPAGLHIPHYPSNYLPYSQYFSPFFVPPPTLHHFLSNTAFPQQPPTRSIYQPPPAAAAATPIRYPISQYKPGTNTGNSNHAGMPPGYGAYNSAPGGYSPSPADTSGNSTGNEDLPASQYKDNNVYIAGQQSEGSTVWIPAPGRNITSFQPNSFYNLPPQGQHMTFPPTQANPGAFAGIFHPTQTVTAAAVHPMLQQSQAVSGAVEMVAPPTSVYQQPQRAQINWGNSY